MKKKQYISPVLNVYLVNPCEVICGSGGVTETLNGTSGNMPTPGAGGSFIGNSAERRNGWEDYEGR